MADTQRILNCTPSFRIEKDWRLQDAIDANIRNAAVELPTHLDLGANWWSIADQGANGSCVGWALGDGVLRWHFVRLKKIKKTERLSARYLWMGAKETDPFTERPTTFIEEAGTSLKAALDLVRKYGCVKESLFKFGGSGVFSKSENAFYAAAAQLKIKAYFNLLSPFSDPILSWKQWLADGGGPILIRLEVDTNWMDAASSGGFLDSFNEKDIKGGHAAAIVGYTPDHILIRNSWGKQWGNEGLAYASYPYARRAIAEAYGVMAD